MSILKINHVKDLSGIGGFQLEAANITTNGTLRVTNLAINGVINGTASSIIPALPGSNYYLTTNGSSLSWQEVSSSGGFKSMQVWTGNGTWSKPQGIRSILVKVVGAGGGGSGYTEAGGAGGHGEVIVDVNNVNSVGVTVGSPGGGAYYNGCGGNGNASSFGGYVSANGGTGANCHNQYAGGLGGHGSGGNLNAHGGGGTGHGSHYSYGNMMGGASYMGGSQPGCHHRNHHYAHSHESYAAWGAGGNGAEFGYRGARGREGVVVVYEYA